LLCVCTALLGLTGCDSSSTREPGSVVLVLGHSVDDEALVTNQMQYTSPAGHTYGVSLLEYLISDVVLIQEGGTEVPVAAVHYRNANDPATRQLTASDVPAGHYTGLSFIFGVQGEDNVFGSLPRTTAYDNMMWPAMMPMGDGTTERYHYMRFEGNYDASSAFLIHAGPSSGGDYSYTFTLPVDLNVDGNTWEVELQMNLNEWLTDPNTWDFDDYGMIMGNPSAQALLKANGTDVFSVAATDEQ
jgi:hypothetical protein